MNDHIYFLATFSLTEAHAFRTTTSLEPATPDSRCSTRRSKVVSVMFISRQSYNSRTTENAPFFIDEIPAWHMRNTTDSRRHGCCLRVGIIFSFQSFVLRYWQGCPRFLEQHACIRGFRDLGDAESRPGCFSNPLQPSSLDQPARVSIRFTRRYLPGTCRRSRLFPDAI